MNKLKLGKKKLLGFMTAGAIVVTMAGSYAAWDKLSDTKSASLTLDKPVTTELALTNSTFTAGTRVLGEANTYTDSVTFKIDGIPTTDPATKVDVAFTPIIKNGDVDVSENFDVIVSKTDGETATPLEGNIEKDVNNGESTYKIEITPTDAAASNETLVNNLSAQALSVEITGTLSKE